MINYVEEYKKRISEAIDQGILESYIDMVNNSVRLSDEEKEDLK